MSQRRNSQARKIYFQSHPHRLLEKREHNAVKFCRHSREELNKMMKMKEDDREKFKAELRK